jgi:hypothetical protein
VGVALQPRVALFTATVTRAALLYGVQQLPDCQRKKTMEAAIDSGEQGMAGQRRNTTTDRGRQRGRKTRLPESHVLNRRDRSYLATVLPGLRMRVAEVTTSPACCDPTSRRCSWSSFTSAWT